MNIPTERIGIERILRASFIARHGCVCTYCKRASQSTTCDPDGVSWHIDHMLPLALGGANVEENLTLACARCNMAKRVAPQTWLPPTPEERARQRSRLLPRHIQDAEGYIACMRRLNRRVRVSYLASCLHLRVGYVNTVSEAQAIRTRVLSRAGMRDCEANDADHLLAYLISCSERGDTSLACALRGKR